MDILLTGATGKIGGALISFLTEKGCQLIHPRVDLASIDDLRKLVQEAGKHGLDAIIHCASCFEQKDFSDITLDDWNRALDVDLRAAFFLAQEGAKVLRKGGKMIFFSDIAAEKVYRQFLPYSIAKAGVNALTKGLARILAPSIAVNALALYRVGKGDDETNVEEIKEVVWKLLSDEMKVTGKIIRL